MDSGNSGSLQSSSSGGGDEEYDSRAESISAFLNPTAHIGHMSDPPPPHHHHLHTTTTPMFDSLSNYFDTMSRPPQPPPFSTPNALLNLDMVWSKTLRSDPNYTQINPILASSASPTVPYRPATEVTPSTAASSDQTAHVARNPKKRSRASRRAPTTVLTTDTTNFRAMVQEFTGVPAPPFTSSPFPRTRLDLFATPSSIRSNPSSLSISQPPYLLRPFAQKLQPPTTTSSLFMTNSSSSMLDHNIASTSTNNNNNNNITFTCANSSTSNTSASTNNTNSQQLGLLKQSDLFLNMQDPSLTFHSLLQSQPKYPLPNSSILGGSKTQGSFGIQSNLKMGALDEFGLGHGGGGGGGHVNSSQLSGLPNLVCADGTPATRNDDIDPMRWGCGADTSDGNQSNLRSLNGNFDYSRNLLKGKLNSSSSASSTDFHGEKGQGNGATTRGEGMVESWICSSD